MAKVILITFMMTFTPIVLSKDLYSSQISEDLIDDQERYTSKIIYKMIQTARKDNNLCNIDVSLTGTGFVVKKDGHSFGYVNLKDEIDPELSHYQCLLMEDRKSLECERRLPRENNSIFQLSDIYVHLTIHLDEKGNAVSMNGLKSRRYNLAGDTLGDIFEKKITSFKCDIEHTAVATDPTVRNGVGRAKKSSKSITSDEQENSGTVQK